MTKQHTAGDHLQLVRSNDPGRRLQYRKAIEEYKNVQYLNDEEKQLSVSLFVGPTQTYDYTEVADHAALKQREPCLGMWQQDPNASIAFMTYYEHLAGQVMGLTSFQMGYATTRPAGIDGVTDDPELKKKFRRSMLMQMKIAHMNDDEWFTRVVATTPKLFTAEQCSVIGNSASSAWSEDDSLTLRFTEAFLRGRVSDELFEEACRVWNPKIVYQFTLWIGAYHMMSLQGLLNMADEERSGRLRL